MNPADDGATVKVTIKLLSHPVFGDYWCPAVWPCIYTWRSYAQSARSNRQSNIHACCN